MTSLETDSRISTHQPTQVLSIAAGGGEITVVKTAFYSEPEKIAQAQLARVLMGRAGGKASRIAGGNMLAEAAGFEAWDRLTDGRASTRLQVCSLNYDGTDGRRDPRQGFGAEKGGRVGEVGSGGASRDGVSGHERARASGRGVARQSFGAEKGGRVGEVGSCGASRDGVSGHERARASGRGWPRQGFGDHKGGRVGVVGSGGAKRDDIRGNGREEQASRTQEMD